MNATIDKLPLICAARLPSTGEPIYLRRGEQGYWPAGSDVDPDDFNQALGVTPAQREAMLAGSMFGWHTPGADPEHPMYRNADPKAWNPSRQPEITTEPSFCECCGAMKASPYSPLCVACNRSD